MIFLKFIIITISAVLPGYLLFRLFFNNLSWGPLKIFPLSWGLGSFFITIQLFFVLFILKLPLGNWIFWLFLLENLIMIYFAHKQKVLKIKFQTANNFSLKESLVILLIVFQLLFSLIACLSRPVIVYDSIAMWSMRAKTLFYNHNLADFNPNSFYYLGGQWHVNYPWHVPLIQYWSVFAANDFSEVLINLIFFLFFVGVLLALYSFLRDHINRFYALLFTFFCSSAPLFFYHSFNPYADLPLSFYLLSALILLFAWLEKGDFKNLILASLFFGLSFFVKVEAIIFIIAALIIVLIHSLIKKKYRAIKLYLAGILLPNIFWIFFLIKYKLTVANVGSELGWHPEIFKSLLSSIFIANSWNIWWFIFFVFFVVYLKLIIRIRALFLIWLFFTLSALGFLVLYLFTDEYQFVVDYTAVGRNLVLFLPSSVFLTAILLKYNLKPKKNPNDG